MIIYTKRKQFDDTRVLLVVKSCGAYWWLLRRLSSRAKICIILFAKLPEPEVLHIIKTVFVLCSVFFFVLYCFLKILIDNRMLYKKPKRSQNFLSALQLIMCDIKASQSRVLLITEVSNICESMSDGYQSKSHHCRVKVLKRKASFVHWL